MADSNPFDAKDISFTEARSGHMRFAPFRIQGRTISFPHPKDICCTCYEPGGIKMKCGHYVCSNDLLDHSWKQVEAMKYEISCIACSQIIPPEDIIRFGLPNEEEELFLTTAITTNFYESQDIQECPQCRTLCSRQKTDTPEVHCKICQKKGGKSFIFCWHCLKEWRNAGNHQDCGNANCRRESIQMLLNSPMKSFSDANKKTISIPMWRACPNRKCSTLIEHVKDCNSMTCCKCGTVFCFICLSRANGGSLDCRSRSYNATGIKCVPAPLQTKL